MTVAAAVQSLISALFASINSSQTAIATRGFFDNMPVSAKTIEHVLSTTSPNLKISFPGTNITAAGHKVSKQDARATPELSLKSPTPPSKTYICVSLDPDAPFPSFPFLGPALHSIQTGLSAEAESDNDGWVKLRAGGKPVVHWAPPAPPGISAPHRYVFLLWEQPEGLTDEKIRQQMGWGTVVGLTSRARWDQAGFEARFGLEDFVGGNWFSCG
jgi:phosphatidylethanolamine-binding protein (PEBP) family uncharacterized protein